MNFQLVKCASKRNATHCLQVTRIGRRQRKLGFAMPTAPLIPTALAALVASAALFPVSARQHRSREVTREFQREHPCPSIGTRSGRCPGYIKDHIVPLACGGADAVWNMQWQTIATAKDTDVTSSANMEILSGDPIYWLRVFRLIGLTCKVLELLILALSPEPIYGPLFLGGQNDKT